MSELAAPLSREARSRLRLVAMERTREQIAVLESQFRLDLTAWVEQDFGFGVRVRGR